MGEAPRDWNTPMTFHPNNLANPHEKLLLLDCATPVTNSAGAADKIRLYWSEEDETFWAWNNFSDDWEQFGEYDTLEAAKTAWRAYHSIPAYSGRDWIPAEELGKGWPSSEFTDVFEYVQSLHMYVRSEIVVYCGIIESEDSDLRHLLRVGKAYFRSTDDSIESATYLGEFDDDTAAKAAVPPTPKYFNLPSRKQPGKLLDPAKLAQAFVVRPSTAPPLVKPLGIVLFGTEGLVVWCARTKQKEVFVNMVLFDKHNPSRQEQQQNRSISKDLPDHWLVSHTAFKESGTGKILNEDEVLRYGDPRQLVDLFDQGLLRFFTPQKNNPEIRRTIHTLANLPENGNDTGWPLIAVALTLAANV